MPNLLPGHPTQLLPGHTQPNAWTRQTYCLDTPHGHCHFLNSSNSFRMASIESNPSPQSPSSINLKPLRYPGYHLLWLWNETLRGGEHQQKESHHYQVRDSLSELISGRYSQNENWVLCTVDNSMSKHTVIRDIHQGCSLFILLTQLDCPHRYFMKMLTQLQLFPQIFFEDVDTTVSSDIL